MPRYRGELLSYSLNMIAEVAEVRRASLDLRSNGVFG